MIELTTLEGKGHERWPSIAILPIIRWRVSRHFSLSGCSTLGGGSGNFLFTVLM